MKKHSYLIILLFAFLCWSCGNQERKYIYPQNPAFSNPNGDPVDSMSLFFPFQLKYGDSVVSSGIDTTDNFWYSTQIFPAKDRVLFNYYLGHDIYRFTWLRSFHNPIFITLNKKEGRVWLEIKKLDRKPQFMSFLIDSLPPNFSELDSIQIKALKRNYKVIQPNRYAELEVNERKELTLIEWEEFERILQGLKYLNMPSVLNELPMLDGSRWIIEAHLEDKYWFVDRWSPKDGFEHAGEYLIQLSGLKEEGY